MAWVFYGSWDWSVFYRWTCLSFKVNILERCFLLELDFYLFCIIATELVSSLGNGGAVWCWMRIISMCWSWGNVQFKHRIKLLPVICTFSGCLSRSLCSFQRFTLEYREEIPWEVAVYILVLNCGMPCNCDSAIAVYIWKVWGGTGPPHGGPACQRGPIYPKLL